MGLGPPVCVECMVVGKLSQQPSNPWCCPICGDKELRGSLWTYTIGLQNIINKRSNLFTKKYPRTHTLKTSQAVVRRKFMIGNKAEHEPNLYYRPWLELHVGKQGSDWEWDLCRTNIDLLEILFANAEHATLFELTWPMV